jgi:WD40 repeat protein
VTLVDLATLSQIAHASVPENCCAVAFDTDGSAVGVSRNLVAKRFDPKDLTERASYDLKGVDGEMLRAEALVLARDGKHVFAALGNETRGISSWAIAKNAQRQQLEASPGNVMSIATSSDKIVTGDNDGTVMLLELGRTPAPLAKGQGAVFAVALSASGKLVAWGGVQRKIQIREGRDPRALPSPDEFSHHIFALEFSPDESLLAVSSHGGRVLVWDLRQEKTVATLELGTIGDMSHALAFVDDRTLLVGTERGYLLEFALER